MPPAPRCECGKLRPERGVPAYQKYEPRSQHSTRRYGGWLRASANSPTIARLLEHPSVAVKGLAEPLRLLRCARVVLAVVFRLQLTQ